MARKIGTDSEGRYFSQERIDEVWDRARLFGEKTQPCTDVMCLGMSSISLPTEWRARWAGKLTTLIPLAMAEVTIYGTYRFYRRQQIVPRETHILGHHELVSLSRIWQGYKYKGALWY